MVYFEIGNPPVAKLDIAADSDSEGRGFESLRAGQQKSLFCLPTKGTFLNDVCPVGQMMYHAGMMLPSAMMCALRHMGKHRIIVSEANNIISERSDETSLAA